MATLDLFNPPGNLPDLDEGGHRRWHHWLSCRIDEAILGPSPHRVSYDGSRPQFYNATRTPAGDDAKQAPVTWTAFPRRLHTLTNSDKERWELADSNRMHQDEYCEWSVTRNSENEITKVTFTCEGPEYWELLADYNPAKVLELYQTYVSADVIESDLFVDGVYAKVNKWNNFTNGGAMHLIQPNNTLGAEIELAAAATVRRVVDGRELTGADELIECSAYGVGDRHSDPHIGASVNELARELADITLTDPVGLYFDDLATDGWDTPDGSDPKSYWTYLRGDAHHPVRAVYEVPAEKDFTVSDITIGARPISTGAQIADFITIKLTATACRFGRSTAQPRTDCRVKDQAAISEEAVSGLSSSRTIATFTSRRTPSSI
ncbi:hypothetical protein ACFWSF_34170 [Streptomyces sp. NPDC058611]|uniref:hypothetical protein n=1 Tax=unclassified Streptomyces TaxID=2593676 RepID=UPI0036644DB5